MSPLPRPSPAVSGAQDVVAGPLPTWLAHMKHNVSSLVTWTNASPGWWNYRDSHMTTDLEPVRQREPHINISQELQRSNVQKQWWFHGILLQFMMPTCIHVYVLVYRVTALPQILWTFSQKSVSRTPHAGSIYVHVHHFKFWCQARHIHVSVKLWMID